VRQPDITLARRLLKWEPKVSLDQGLPRTIEYFKAEAVRRTRGPRVRRSWPRRVCRPLPG
jgi:hypothetical protein